jgi:paraquat-inducible protein A
VTERAPQAATPDDPTAGACPDWLVGLLLLAALPLFIAGLVMPAISFTSFALITRTYSLLDGVFAFYASGKYALFVVVFVFSVILPALKILAGLWAWAAGARSRAVLGKVIRAFAAISKWSMLDVFIVAVMVLALEGSLFTTSDIKVGIVLFAAAVVLSTLALLRLVRLTQWREKAM